MNKIGIVFFLLFATFRYSFAEENFANNSYEEVLLGDAYLTVKTVKEKGAVLVLNDGSEWDIKYFGGIWQIIGWLCNEQKEVSHWEIGDIVEIQYPTTGNFFEFILVIYNLSKNEKALVTLKQAPSINNSACLWIVDYDKNEDLVTLNDGTIWLKTKIDMYGSFFRLWPSSQGDWKIGDALTLIREEKGWANSGDLFLLWNHAINEMPCASRLK